MDGGGGSSMWRSDLLLTVSEELSDLGASASAIQATLGEILRNTPAAGGAGFWHMQEIDRLQQTLDDLSAILRVAAEDDGPQLNVERLVQATRLGALRERLRGLDGESATGQVAGTVAMF